MATIQDVRKIHDCAVINRFTYEVVGWLDKNADGTVTLKVGKEKWRKVPMWYAADMLDMTYAEAI